MRAALLLLLAGCWTGTAAAPPIVESTAPKPPLRLRVTLERSYCLGTCPVYAVTVHGDGRVAWSGIANVAVTGPKQTRVERRDIERLARLVDSAQFFDRNANGELQTGPVCTTVNGMTTCSYSAHICTDTSHAKLTITKNGRTHTVDNDHCEDKPGIDEIEDQVDALVQEWIGPR
jgi:hypothetical protein